MGRWTRLVMTFGFLATAGSTLYAQEAEESPPPQSHEELTAALTEQLAQSAIPGAQIVLIEEGQISLSFNYGVSNRDAGTPVTDETVFRAGSISKSFVGVAVMMAVEEGLLSLDMPVAEAAPGVAFVNPWEDTDPLTLAHVMEHSAGFYDISIAEFLTSNPDITIAEGLAINPGNRVSRWRPGTYYSYANSGPPIAAHAVELARGQDFDTILRETVLRPLGMRVSDLQLTEMVEQHLSLSYSDRREDPIPYFHILMRPSGALNTTAVELAGFVRMLIGRGTVDGVQLLSPHSVDRIERSETLEAVEFYDLDGTYGLGNDSMFTRTRVLRGHGGAIDGFIGSYAYDAELRIGFVILVNGDDGGTVQTLQNASAAYLLRNFEPDLPEATPINEAELAGYAGHYVVRTPGGRFDALMSAFTPTISARYDDVTGLTVAGIPRVPNGDHTMRRLERAESSFARAYDSTYRRELRYTNITYVQIPLWQVVARMAFPVGMALGALIIVLFELVRFGLFVIPNQSRTSAVTQKGPRFMRLNALLSVASMAGVIYILWSITQLHFTELAVLTAPNLTTVSVFMLTILVPLFALFSLWTALFVPGGAGKWNRALHAFSAALIITGSLWLSQWGWVGLQLWTF